MALMRTAKSCRSDAPMPASSLREEARATVPNKRGHREEREVSRKTIARGMPGVSGVTVVTTLVRFFCCARGCGRIVRPAFPAPSVLREANELAKLGRNRAAGMRSLDVIARSDLSAVAQRAKAEATKQSSLRHSGMVRRTRPQMRNCASGNLEIPGSMLRIAPE